jgi:hypothetical protein
VARDNASVIVSDLETHQERVDREYADMRDSLAAAHLALADAVRSFWAELGAVLADALAPLVAAVNELRARWSSPAALYYSSHVIPRRVTRTITSPVSAGGRQLGTITSRTRLWIYRGTVRGTRTDVTSTDVEPR